MLVTKQNLVKRSKYAILLWCTKNLQSIYCNGIWM